MWVNKLGSRLVSSRLEAAAKSLWLIWASKIEFELSSPVRVQMPMHAKAICGQQQQQQQPQSSLAEMCALIKDALHELWTHLARPVSGQQQQQPILQLSRQISTMNFDRWKILECQNMRQFRLINLENGKESRGKNHRLFAECSGFDAFVCLLLTFLSTTLINVYTRVQYTVRKVEEVVRGWFYTENFLKYCSTMIRHMKERLTWFYTKLGCYYFFFK